MLWRKAISNPYPGVDPDGKSPGGITVAGDVDSGRLLEGGVHIGEFSGCLAINNGVGITCADGIGELFELVATAYDIGGYFSALDATIKLPKDGYYSVVSGFIADNQFVGEWELQGGLFGKSWKVDGTGNAVNLAEGQLIAVGYGAKNDLLHITLTQNSGASQIVYPYMATYYLGS